jgi:fucose permease
MATTYSAPRPVIRSGQLILAAVLAIFVYGVTASMLGTVMSSFKFPLTAEQKGNIFFAQAIGLVLASISVGPLIDNKGKKIALLIALALIAGSLFIIPSAASYEQVMILWLVEGLGGGILVTAANSLVSDIGEEKRASTLNFLNLFFGLGGLATPFITANLLGGDTVKLCYLAAILTAVTLALHIATTMPPPSGERGFKLSEAGLLLGRPALYLLALFLFLYVACEVGVWNWLATYLKSRGIDEKTALNILALGFALGLLVGRVVVSRILMKVPAPTVTLFAAIFMAITTYATLQTTDATMAAIAVFCAGLAMAPVFPTTLAMVGDAFPRATATAMGIVITCGWIGLAVSSPIIGSIAGTGESANLKNALLVLPIFSVIMVLVNLVLRPMLRRA